MEAETLALITAAAGGLTNAVVNGITMAWPERPKWAAFLLACMLGILLSGVAAFAYLPPDVAIDRQMLAQLVITGLFAGLGAAGLGVTQASAESRRKEAGVTSEPDPTTPKAGVE